MKGIYTISYLSEFGKSKIQIVVLLEDDPDKLRDYLGLMQSKGNSITTIDIETNFVIIGE